LIAGYKHLYTVEKGVEERVWLGYFGRQDITDYCRRDGGTFALSVGNDNIRYDKRKTMARYDKGKTTKTKTKKGQVKTKVKTRQRREKDKTKTRQDEIKTTTKIKTKARTRQNKTMQGQAQQDKARDKRRAGQDTPQERQRQVRTRLPFAP
jgi:hypothetical protein